jgi:steroid delta-isomerase-like uncharacterized protein
MSDQTREKNRQTVVTLFESFSSGGDLSHLDDLIAPDYVGPQGDKGPDGFRKVIMGLRTAFPDIHYTIDDVLADGDRVAIRWHWTGTHKAQFRVIPATGKSVTNPGLAIFKLADGKVVSAALETDRLGFLEQIGAVPPNGGFGGPRPSPPQAAHQ